MENTKYLLGSSSSSELLSNVTTGVISLFTLNLFSASRYLVTAGSDFPFVDFVSIELLDLTINHKIVSLQNLIHLSVFLTLICRLPIAIGTNVFEMFFKQERESISHLVQYINEFLLLLLHQFADTGTTKILCRIDDQSKYLQVIVNCVNFKKWKTLVEEDTKGSHWLPIKFL